VPLPPSACADRSWNACWLLRRNGDGNNCNC
jgi:hypothetical protein